MLVVYYLELSEQLKQVPIRVVDHQVECELFQHDLLIREDAVSPSPILFALLINNEFGILLGHLGHRNDDVFRLSTVFFYLVG